MYSGGLDSALMTHLICEELTRRTETETAARVDLISVSADPSPPDRFTSAVSFAALTAAFPRLDLRLILADVRRTSETDSLDLETRLRLLRGRLGPSRSNMDASIGMVLLEGGRATGRELSANDPAVANWLSRVRDATPGILEDWSDFIVEVGGDGDATRRLPPRERVMCSVFTCPLVGMPGCAHGGCKSCCSKLRQVAGADAEGLEAAAAAWNRLFPAKAGKPSPVRGDMAAHAECPAHTGVSATSGHAARTARVASHKALLLEGLRLPGPMVTSQAHVLFTGHGADELFAGYGRHRSALERGGLPAARNELRTDLQRIWKRNLGRDDRVCGTFGRITRTPFLAEDIVELVATMRVSDLLPGSGAGADKTLLRALAASVGCGVAARFKKRAAQFGSRTGRLFDDLSGVGKKSDRSGTREAALG